MLTDWMDIDFLSEMQPNAYSGHLCNVIFVKNVLTQ